VLGNHYAARCLDAHSFGIKSSNLTRAQYSVAAAWRTIEGDTLRSKSPVNRGVFVSQNSWSTFQRWNSRAVHVLVHDSTPGRTY